MTVFLDGVEKYDWPVSTGKAGYSTPSGTYTATSMNEIWYSKQWDNAPMPHSIFFMKDGHAIHGSNEVRNSCNAAAHGCVRISPENAATLYALVAKNGLQNTQVVLTGTTPAVSLRSPSSGRRCPLQSGQCRRVRECPTPTRPASSSVCVVGFSAADEIEKLDRLKKAGSISETEFARLRAKLV